MKGTELKMNKNEILQLNKAKSMLFVIVIYY